MEPRYLESLFWENLLLTCVSYFACSSDVKNLSTCIDKCVQGANVIALASASALVGGQKL